MATLVATFGGDRIKIVEVGNSAVITCNRHYWTGREWVKGLCLAKTYKSVQAAKSTISRQSVLDQMIAQAKRLGIFD